MEAIRPSIEKLALPWQSAWRRMSTFAEHLPGALAVQFGAKPEILRLDGQVLQASPLDQRWREHADDLAADWRDNGLEVSIFERLSKPTTPGAYVLTVRSETLALICTCQSWSDLVTKEPVWSLNVAVRPAEQRVTSLAGIGPLRQLGVVTAPTHEAVWQNVLDWLDSHESFDPAVLDMLGPAMPTAEASAEEPAERQSTDRQLRPLLLFGGASAMAAMIALLFVILGGEHTPEQPAKSFSPLTGAGSSATVPNDHDGDVLEVRAAPAPSVPKELESDELRRSEHLPPIAVFEAHEPDLDALSDHAVISSAGSQTVNAAMLPSMRENPLPPLSPSVEASLPATPADQIESERAVTSSQPDIIIVRPALSPTMRANLEVAQGPVGKRATRSATKSSPPVPRIKPSSPAASDLALVADASKSEIIPLSTMSASYRAADVMESAATRPQNRPEAKSRGPVPLTPIARPEYAVQVAAVTDPAAAPRVW
jgi:hypothetical protein